MYGRPPGCAVQLLAISGTDCWLLIGSCCRQAGAELLAKCFATAVSESASLLLPPAATSIAVSAWRDFLLRLGGLEPGPRPLLLSGAFDWLLRMLKGA